MPPKPRKPQLDSEQRAYQLSQSRDPRGPLFEHLGMGVSETHWESTISFYEQLLGLKPIAAGQGTGTHSKDSYVFMSHSAGGPLIAFIKTDCEPLNAPHHLGFNIAAEEWDATLSRLARAGIPVAEEGQGRDGVAYVYMHDPAGNLFQLIRGRRTFR